MIGEREQREGESAGMNGWEMELWRDGKWDDGDYWWVWRWWHGAGLAEYRGGIYCWTKRGTP